MAEEGVRTEAADGSEDGVVESEGRNVDRVRIVVCGVSPSMDDGMVGDDVRTDGIVEANVEDRGVPGTAVGRS